MKRLTLDETWTLCLRMWKWIAGEVKKGSREDVDDLKAEWLEDNNFEDEYFANDCFFCGYVEERTGKTPYPDEGGTCALCPAKKVAEFFGCCEDEYHYSGKPLAFYAKLVELNKKRLSKKRKC